MFGHVTIRTSPNGVFEKEQYSNVRLKLFSVLEKKHDFYCHRRECEKLLVQVRMHIFEIPKEVFVFFPMRRSSIV